MRFECQTIIYRLQKALAKEPKVNHEYLVAKNHRRNFVFDIKIVEKMTKEHILGQITILHTVLYQLKLHSFLHQLEKSLTHFS